MRRNDYQRRFLSTTPVVITSTSRCFGYQKSSLLIKKFETRISGSLKYQYSYRFSRIFGSVWFSINFGSVEDLVQFGLVVALVQFDSVVPLVQFGSVVALVQ